MQDSPVLEEKIRPFIADALHKFLGVKVAELESELSDKIKQTSLWEWLVDTSLPYREAKRNFRKGYVSWLFQTRFGNIAAVSRLLGIDRRTGHRLVRALRIPITGFRKELHGAQYVRAESVKDAIQSVLEQYKTVLHPEKIKALYAHVPTMSKSLAKELPEQPLSLKDAELEFERKYFATVLVQCQNNVSLASKRAGIRYETLHRKLTKLGLRA
ncbi:MAG: helix-turn-helix domain-containing protein [Candidatus Woesearchaeota archaeon]|nr:helix-turn-helix domain-containing protein [Candidatus Woesearchaeota archaeon]